MLASKIVSFIKTIKQTVMVMIREKNDPSRNDCEIELLYYRNNKVYWQYYFNSINEENIVPIVWPLADSKNDFCQWSYYNHNN